MDIAESLRPAPDVPSFCFPLEEDTRHSIEMNFKASTCPNIETAAQPPDSPSTSLSKASEYLVKMNKKGYMVMQGVPPEQIRRTFNRSLKPSIIPNKHPIPKSVPVSRLSAKSTCSSPVKGETPIKLAQLKKKAANTATTAAAIKLPASPSMVSVSSIADSPPPKTKTKKANSNANLSENSRYKDPELHFFLTSNVLKKNKKKISSLPFIIPEDVYVYVNKLEEKIVEIGHRMIHMRMLDSRKLSRFQLQQNTTEFVVEAEKAAKDVIRSAFKANLINVEQASQNKELVKEFPELFANQQDEATANKTNNNNNNKNDNSDKNNISDKSINNNNDIIINNQDSDNVVSNNNSNFSPSKSIPTVSINSSRLIQSQSSQLPIYDGKQSFSSTINSNISSTNNINDDYNNTFNFAQDEVLLRLFDPSKKTNALPDYYRPDINELKKPEFGIVNGTRQSSCLQMKKKLKKMVNAYEQVLSRPATAPSVHFPQLNNSGQSESDLQMINESGSNLSYLNLTININLDDDFSENRTGNGSVNSQRKMPEVITNDFKRTPKSESKKSSSRSNASSRASRKRAHFQINEPSALPTLRENSKLSSRSVLCSAIESLKTGRENSDIHSRKPTSYAEIQQKEMANKLFWEVADPLGKSREGQFIDQLDTISKLSTEIGITEMISTPNIDDYHPFDFESDLINGTDGQNSKWNKDNNSSIDGDNSQQNSPSKPNNNDDNSTSTNNDNSKANSNGTSESKQNEPENYDIFTFPHLYSLNRNVGLNEPLVGNYDISKSKTRIVTYLQEHEGDFDGDINQSPIYQRLDKIWEELGFTINQKLEMVLKYSKTVEESSKLSEALDAWENAFANIKNYQLTYKNLQLFLTNEALVVPPKKRDMLFAQLSDDLKTAVESVNRSASYLKSTYGDELLMKRKKVGDLMSTRNMKLKMLISKLGIVSSESS